MYGHVWPDEKPINEVKPDRVPNGSHGSIPVIAHLVWPGRHEWWPARAVRWTQQAVLVSIQTDHTNPLANRLVWLAATDVRRHHERESR